MTKLLGKLLGLLGFLTFFVLAVVANNAGKYAAQIVASAGMAVYMISAAIPIIRKTDLTIPKMRMGVSSAIFLSAYILTFVLL